MAKTLTKSGGSSEPYYDLNDDWSLVVASFQSQYGIRLSRELQDMSWREFSYLINGLSGKTPLGQIISVRAEDDPEMLKEFTPEQKRIRSEYRRKVALQKDKKEVKKSISSVKEALKKMSG